jgi:nicotinamide-nucleotide amidase
MNLIERLIEKNLTISAAESLTGGLFQATLVSMEHASKVFLGGVVSYTKEAKCKLLGLTMEEIEKYGVYSNETSLKMASGVKALTNSNISVGISGVAGPGADEGVEAGTVYYSIIFNDEVYNKKINISNSTRQVVREKTVEIIINDLLDLLI